MGCPTPAVCRVAAANRTATTAVRILTQHVQFGVVGIDLIDEKFASACCVSPAPPARLLRALPSEEREFQPIQFDPVNVGRIAQQFENVGVNRYPLHRDSGGNSPLPRLGSTKFSAVARNAGIRVTCRFSSLTSLW